MTYLLQTTDCMIGSAASAIKPSDIYFSLQKGVKYLSFKISFPTSELLWVIKSFTPPACAETCDITLVDFPGQDPALGYKSAAIVRMKMKETSDMYNGSAVESLHHVGSVFIQRRHYKAAEIKIEAVDYEFPDQTNSYALIHKDGTGIAASEFITICGGATTSSGNFMLIMIYANGQAYSTFDTTPNEAVTFEVAIDGYTAGSAYFQWDFGTDVIWVSDKHTKAVTVKFKKAGVYTITVRAYNNSNNDAYIWDRGVIVNRPATPGEGQLVDFFPNENTEPDRMADLEAPVRLRFNGMITDHPTKIHWRIIDHAWEAHGLSSEELYGEYNKDYIEYTFLKTGLYTVKLDVTYNNAVVLSKEYNYTIKNPVIQLEDADFSLTSPIMPTDLTIDFTDVLSRDTITKWFIEYTKTGTFLSDNIDPDVVYGALVANGSAEYEFNTGALPDTVTRTMTEDGICSVKAVVWTNEGILEHKYRNVATISPAGYPTVSFMINNGSLVETVTGNLPFTVTMEATATDMDINDTIKWEFGDGAIIEGAFATYQSVIHNYTVAGTYIVKVTVTNSAGTATFTRNSAVTVLGTFVPHPVLKALELPFNTELDQYVAYAPVDVTIDLSGSFNCDRIEIMWFDEVQEVLPVNGVFGTYTHSFAAYKYNTIGAIWITGYNGENAVALTSRDIGIYSVPIASFIQVPSEIVAGESVSFTDTSHWQPVSYFWNFGDGATSTERDPDHTYLVDGVYTPSLTVTNPAGSHTMTKTNAIVVGVGNLLAGEVTADKQIFSFDENPRATVQFNFSGEDNVNLTYLWDFGDTSFSSEKNPSHTYSVYGEFPVKLTITDGSSGAIRNVVMPRFIRVRKSNAPDADFEILGNVLSGAAPFKVTLIPRCTGEPTDFYKVNFGDSPLVDFYKVAETTSINHVYNTNGQFTITFEAFNEYGADVEVKPNLITVTDAPVVNPSTTVEVKPSYDTSTPLTGMAPLTVQFIDATESLTNDTIISWLWTFGDGGSSSQQNPLYTFLNSGTYHITLKVGTRNGYTYYADYDLIVVATQNGNAPVVAVTPDFMTYHTIGVFPFTTTFFSTSEGNPIGYAWLFGDEPPGTPFPAFDANKAIVKHTYMASGVYTVQLKVQNSLGEATVVKKNYIVVSEWATSSASVPNCEPNLIGDVLVQAIDSFHPTGENEEVEIKNKNTLRSFAYTIPNILENVTMHGFMWQDGKTEDEFAEDIESVRFRDGSYNYIDLAGKRGFLAIKTVDIPKEAETQTMRDFDIDARFMSATMFERTYTMESSIYNSVINGIPYTTDHPPTISLPVNAYNVKIKSPWQTINLKEPAYLMNSSEGQIPIYQPFKLYTSEDPSMTISPGVKKVRTIDQFGFATMYIPPLGGGVGWHLRVGVDIPLGKYRIAVKLKSVPANNNQAQNVPEIGEMVATGNNLTNNTQRMIVWDKKIHADPYDNMFYSDEVDLTSTGEQLNIFINNTRADATLKVQYIFLQPTYHAKLSFDCPKEYYTGEMKVYDFNNGVAKRVYNVNHEFKGSIYICNAFMRWIIDPKKKWYETGDITHTQYKVTTRGNTSIYTMDDKRNMGTRFAPIVYSNSYPNIVFKRILPNIVEFDLAFDNGLSEFGGANGNMVTTVHAMPHTFKFYNKRNGEMQYDWQLVNKYGFPAFNYFNGKIISKYGDSYDRTSGHTVKYSDDEQIITNEMKTLMTVYGDYMYTMSFEDDMFVRLSYSNNNITFPAYRTKGNYQFSLNVFPMYTDKYYNYSDDLVCTDYSMQRKHNSTENDKQIDVDAIANGDKDSFWNLFESMHGDPDNITSVSKTEGFTITHNNQYDKGYMYDTIRLQNIYLDYMKMSFDVKMTAPITYVSSMHVVLFKTADNTANHTLSILNDTTYNLRYVITNYKTGITQTYWSTVDLNMLEGTHDHIVLEVLKDFNYMTTHDTIIRGEFNGIPIHWTDGVDDDILEIPVTGVVTPAPVEIRFNQMYGCNINVKNMTIRPYLTSYQHFKGYLTQNLMRMDGSDMVPTDLGSNRHSVFESAVTDAVTFMKVRDGINGAWLKIKNNAVVILKSYKMLSGQYRVRFMPHTANTTFTFFVSTNLNHSGPIDSVYYEIALGNGTCSLKHLYEDGTTETIASKSFTALTLDTLYELDVKVDDLTNEMSLYIRKMSDGQTVNFMRTSSVDPKHIKYGKIGFKSDKELYVDDYDITGIEKFGRGPQICRYLDDFDFANGDIADQPTGGLQAYGTKPILSDSAVGKIYACNFARGGEGTAYHDTTTTNQGSAKDYRTDETTKVDLVDWGLPANVTRLSDADKAEENKVVVAYTATGEWLKYPVNVIKNGTYTIQVRASNGTTSVGQVKVTVANGTTVTLNINPTGAWATFATVSADIVVPYIGTNEVIKVEPVGDINIMWMKFTYKNATGAMSGATVGNGPSNLFKTEYQTTTAFKHYMNTGTIVSQSSGNQVNWIYPNGVRPFLFDATIMIRNTQTASADHRGGLIFNVNTFTGMGLPLDGYGVFLNFKTKALELVLFKNSGGAFSVVPLDTKVVSLFTVTQDHWYHMRVNRQYNKIDVYLMDAFGVEQMFTFNINISGQAKYDHNGCIGPATYSTLTGIEFDDFDVDRMQFKNTNISMVSLGGVSHGGEYDVETAVFDKVVPNVTLPYGFYFIVANAHSTAIGHTINFRIGNFTDNSTIIVASMEEGKSYNIEQTDIVGRDADQFVKYVVKLDQSCANDECGIEIYQPTDNVNYVPTMFVNYIIMIPYSGLIGKQIFLSELAAITRSPSVINRKLDEKKIA